MVRAERKKATARALETVKPAAEEAAAEDGIRRCHHPNCTQPGDYRAPKSREPRDGHIWFCLDHVRAYNARWNFFAGMSDIDIEHYIKSDMHGHRPTWKLGTRPEPDDLRSWVQDDLGLLSEVGLDDLLRGAREPSGAKKEKRLDPEVQRALTKMNLKHTMNKPVTLQQVKARYKELAKRYHPDANGGDKAAEERLKDINQAYSFLLSRGYI